MLKLNIARCAQKCLLLVLLLHGRACFGTSYSFTAGGGLSPNTVNFPTNPLTLDVDNNFVNVSSGTMSALSGSATITTQNNGFSNDITVQIGATLDFSGGGAFANTINLDLGDGSQHMTVTNNGIIKQGATATSGNAIFMNFQQNAGTNVITITNRGLIQGSLNIATGTSAPATYRMEAADPSVNNGVTQITGTFANLNNVVGTIFSIGASTNTNFTAAAMNNIPSYTIANNSTFRMTGAVTGVNQAFSIPSGCSVFFDPAGSFASSSTFTNNAGGNLNIANTFVPSTADAGGFTNSGNIYVFNSGLFNANLSGGQTFNVGLDSASNAYPSTNYITAGTIAIPIIHIYNGSFTAANAISGVTNSFTVDSGATATFNAALSGTNGAFTNNGTTFIGGSGSIGTTGAFNNAGNLNIATATFNVGTYSSFTNSGALFLLTGGNFTANLTTGTSLSIGRDSNANPSANNFTANNITVNLPAINVYNNSSITTAGTGNVTTTNLYILGNGTFSGTVTASALNTGKDSFNNTDNTTAFSAGGAFSTIPSINVFNGTFTNNTHAFTNVSTFTIANGSSATLNADFAGSATSATSSNSGTLNLQSTFNLVSFTNNSNGIINIQTGAVINANIVNNGTIAISTTLSGTGSITNNASSNFSISTGGSFTIPPSFTNSGTISTSGTGTLTVSNPLSGKVTNGGIANVTAAMTPSSTSSNSGTININSNGSLTIPATFSNTGTIATSGTGILTVSQPLSGIVTNAGRTDVTAAFTPANTSNNSGTTNVNSSGNFTIPATYTNSGTIATSGTGILTVSNPLSGIVTNGGTTTVTAAFTPANTSSNSGITNVNSNGSLTIPATYTNSGTIATSGTGILTVSNPLSGIVTNGGTTTVTAAFTPATTSSNSGITNVNSNGSLTIPATYTNSGTIATSGTGILTVSNPLSGIVTNGGTTTVTAAFTPADNSNNSNITNVNANGSLTIPAIYTNSGTIATSGTGILTVGNALSGIVNNAGRTDVTAAFTPGSTSSNTGIMNINGGSFTQPTPTYTNTGTINVNTNAPFASAISGGAGSILNIGNANSVTFGTTNTITNIENIHLITSGTAFTVNNPVTGVKTAFTVGAGTSADIAATFTGLGAGTNNDTLNIRSTFGLASLTNNSGATLTFALGTNNSTPIFNLAGGIFNVSGNSLNSAAIQNSGNMTISAGLSSTGTITNNPGGTLALTDGANIADAIQNNGTMTTAGNITITNNVVNDGTLTIGNSSNINMAGFTLSGTGLVNISGTNALTATNYTNSGTHHTTITNQATFDQLNVTGAVHLAGLNVSSPFVGNPNVTYTWPVITATGGITGPTSTTFPSTDWSVSVVGNSLVVQFLLVHLTYLDLAVGSVNKEIAQVLTDIANDITNPGQQALINTFNANIRSPNFNTYLHEMMPNMNAIAAPIIAQSTILTKATIRAAALREHRTDESVGISSGDITPNTALWISALGNIAKQKAQDQNDGYRARIAGGLLGIDTRSVCDILGVALGTINSNVYESSNTNFTTRTLSYYGLVYGTYFERNSFFEWVFVGGYNINKESREINIGNTNLNTNASYHSWQGGLKFNLGNFTDFCNIVRFSHLLSMQYSYFHQPAYDEYNSVAALHVSNRLNTNIFTIGTGVRISLPGEDPWMTGSRELRAAVTYDVINPKQITTSNFIVGSPSFSLINTPVRLAGQFGADFAVTIFNHLQLQLSYDLEIRSRFYDNSAEIKIKYLF